MKSWMAYSVAITGALLVVPGPGLAQSVSVPAAPEVTTAQPAAAVAAALPHNLSPIGMFMSADWVVKAVMLGLLLASAVTWTIWIAKSLELAAARRRAHKAVKVVLQAHSLSDAVAALADESGPGAQLVQAAAEEVRLSMAAVKDAGNEGLKERVASRLSRIEQRAGRHMAMGTGLLASIGSVAPFVGLFGTVWGIMNAFIGISQAQTTNLAVVAPGIAEALLATAIGLVAAIPAVIIYNMFARSIGGYRHILGDGAAGVERLVSRDLDFHQVNHHARKPALVSAAE